MESWEGLKERVGATAQRGREATEEVSNVCATRGSENEGRGRVEKKETDAREVRRLCERIYVRGHHPSFGLMGVIQFRILNETCPAITVSLCPSITFLSNIMSLPR